MLADGERSPIGKFYFIGAQMLDKSEVDQNSPVAEGKVPLRQDRRQIGKFCGGFDWTAGELEPRPALPGFRIDDAGGRQPAQALFRGQQDLFFLAKGFIAV